MIKELMSFILLSSIIGTEFLITPTVDKAKIIDMIANGQVKKDTLLWKQGTPTWEKALSFSEFASFFPPEIPIK